MVRVCALALASWGSQFSPARTAILLLGVVAFVTVTVLPFLLNRIKRRRQPKEEVFAGTDVRHAPPQRPKMYIFLLRIAALCSAAAVVAAICLPQHDAEPTQESTPPPVVAPIALPAASAIGPGAGIYVDYADGSGGMGCTAGFLVRTSTGQTAVLTAGHCNRPGERSKVAMNLGGILPYTTMGTFSQTISEGVRTQQHDIGLIVLDGDNVPQTSAIGASLPVSGVATDLQIGQQLCKFGMATGEAECGETLDVTDSKIAFLATGKCGDSGGPVYLIGSDGTASAVGIDIRGLNPDKADAGCSAPAKFSVAELVQPWLDKWNLTAVTNQPAGPG
ncbi:MAG TPA: endopeptidase [Mycobacterium sp.]|nr:endopeptidase [Mycobacterium sp.]